MTQDWMSGNYLKGGSYPSGALDWLEEMLASPLPLCLFNNTHHYHSIHDMHYTYIL